MILLRIFLISLIVYLIIRSFVRYWAEGHNTARKREREDNQQKTRKGVPKEVGEYIDYEELKKK